MNRSERPRCYVLRGGGAVTTTGNASLLPIWLSTKSSYFPGANTGLAGPRGIAVDSNGNIYVVSDGLLYNGAAVAPFGVTSPRVTVYSAGSSGNVAPIATIGGSLTGLTRPTGIALGPPIENP